MLSCYCKQVSLDRKIPITPSEDSDTALADEGRGGGSDSEGGESVRVAWGRDYNNRNVISR